MGSKILVCALCSQDFTRGYSANRHNQNLHHGQGKIVRMIDYVIGRIAGEYNAANPLAYRSSYSQQASSSAHSDAKAFRFPSTFIAHDSSQGDSTSAFSRTNEYIPNQQPSTNTVQTPPIIPIIKTRSKVEEIQKLIQIHCPPELAETFLKQLSVALGTNRGNEEIRDRCLGALRNNSLIEAYFYLLEASTKKSHERPPLHGHHVENFPESSRIKLTRIEQLLKIRLKNDVAVFEEIERLIKVCNAQRHHSILDLALGSLG